MVTTSVSIRVRLDTGGLVTVFGALPPDGRLTHYAGRQDDCQNKAAYRQYMNLWKHKNSSQSIAFLD